MDVLILFEVQTPLGFSVRCTRAYWEFLVTYKHPVLRGREEEVMKALGDPDEVRQSRTDPKVLLFYKTDGPRRWVCAITRQADNHAFLVRAYPTDAIKEGTRIWPK